MNFIYCDSALISHQGHFASHCRCISQAIRERGIATVVLAHAAIDKTLANELSAHPHFTAHPNTVASQDSLCGWLVNFEYGVNAMLQDLTRINGVTAFDIIFYDHAKPAQIAGLIDWIQKSFRPEDSPAVIITLGWHTGVSPRQAEGRFYWQLNELPSILYRYASLKLKEEYASRMHFAAYDETTATVFGELLSRKVNTFHLPSKAVTGCRSRVGTRSPIIAFLGEQRPDKGYHHVPAIVEQLLARDDKVRILVQNSWQQMEEQNRALQQIAERNERLEVHIGTVDASGWAALLDRADAIVLPYDQAVYASAISAISVEAVANAVPLAVPAGTAMQHLLERHGMPGVVFERSEPSSVCLALDRLLSDFDSFAARAITASRRWQEQGGPAVLANRILELAMSHSMLTKAR